MRKLHFEVKTPFLSVVVELTKPFYFQTFEIHAHLNKCLHTLETTVNRKKAEKLFCWTQLYFIYHF